MFNPKLLEEFSTKLSDLLAKSPARDIEKNFRALVGGAMNHLDLVTREEFDIQREVLNRTREKLKALEARLAELEAKQK